LKEYLKLNNEVLNTYTLTKQIDREKDTEAARRYFLDEINTKTVFFHNLKEKLDYLVEEDYYEEEFLQKYDFKFIKKVFNIAYKYKYRFPSFMSAFKFYNNYALKTRDGQNILERYEDRVAVTALYLAEGDTEFAEKAVRYMMESYQPATPTALNCGKKARGEFVSCFKLMVDDSMNSIAHNIGNSLQLSKLGGGVGISLMDLRCARDPIKGIENRASGVMPVAKLLENSFSYANQLGSRPGSGVIWLNIFHGDIMDFLSAKKPNADEKIRLATLSTGIVVPDIFFKLMEEDKDIFLFSPLDIQKKYGKRMSEVNLTEVYYELLDDPNVRKLKKINARKLYTEVKKTQIESGYPFEMFEDNVRKGNPNKGGGKVKISNLC
jgi:ribonucleoside-diphosphate reductase alpha chain